MLVALSFEPFASGMSECEEPDLPTSDVEDLPTSDDEAVPLPPVVVSAPTPSHPCTKRRRCQRDAGSSVMETLPDSLCAHHVALWALQEAQKHGLLDQIIACVRLHNGRVTIASLCSGMGMENLAAAGLEAAWCQLQLEPPLRFLHAFGCEIHKGKRQLYMDSYPVAHMFEDAAEMQKASAFCHKEGKHVPIPCDIDILCAGFPCTSISALNCKPKSIDDQSSKTGAGFASVWAYCQMHRPKLVMLENVMRLTQRRAKEERAGIEVIMERMGMIGYIGSYKKLDASQFLCPQRRGRVYMWFVRTAGKLRCVDFAKVVSYFSRQKHLPLLPLLCQPVPAAAQVPAQHKACTKDKFQAKHDKFAKDNGLNGLDTYEGRLSAAAGFMPHAHLTVRQRHALLLQYAALRKNGRDPSCELIILQLDQEVDRMPMQTDVSPCIVPHGVYWISNQERFLSGREACSLQGALAGEVLAKANDAMLRDLAGNGFTVPVVIVSLLALFSEWR